MAKQSQKVPKLESKNFGQFLLNSKKDLKELRELLERIGVRISREYSKVSYRGNSLVIRSYGVNVAYPDDAKRALLSSGYGWHIRRMKIIPQNTVPESFL